jgi:hypothetical protein
MKKRTIFRGAPLIAAIGALGALGFTAFQSCGRSEPVPRQIRAHTRIIHGISHAEPADEAERYCSACHGKALAGGTLLEPSCYQCHGRNWTQAAAALAQVSPAPADHTRLEGGRFRHKEALFAPEGDCTACHGEQLQGSASHPSCFLCHARLW